MRSKVLAVSYCFPLMNSCRVEKFLGQIESWGSQVIWKAWVYSQGKGLSSRSSREVKRGPSRYGQVSWSLLTTRGYQSWTQNQPWASNVSSSTQFEREKVEKAKIQRETRKFAADFEKTKLYFFLPEIWSGVFTAFVAELKAGRIFHNLYLFWFQVESPYRKLTQIFRAPRPYVALPKSTEPPKTRESLGTNCSTYDLQFTLSQWRRPEDLICKC